MASFRANTAHSSAAPFNAVTDRAPANLAPMRVRDVSCSTALSVPLVTWAPNSHCQGGHERVPLSCLAVQGWCTADLRFSAARCITCLVFLCGLPGGSGGGAAASRAAGAALC
jgi:hypothetical protein